MGVSTLSLKDLNARLVRRALKNARSATVRDLSAATGLSTVTVGTILQEFVSDGTALEADMVPSNGGRPSRVFQFNAAKAFALVLYGREIERHDTLCLRVADLDGRITDSENIPFEAESIESFDAAIERMLNLFPEIGVIGFGLPGIEYGGILIEIDYDNLAGGSLRGHIEEQFGLPVVIENDVNAAVLGRGRLEGAAESEVYVYFPEKSPPGAGIRIRDQLLKGRRNSAGEVKWIPLDIPWGTSSLLNSPRILDAVAKIIVTITAVIAPESVVLYGKCLTPSLLSVIRENCIRLLPNEMVPVLSLADDFGADFEEGLVGLCLDELENKDDLWRHFS